MAAEQDAPRPDPWREQLAGLLTTAANVVEYVRFGGLETGEQPSPFEVVARDSAYRLRRYFPHAATDRTPVLLVPPLMLTADVWDVSPTTSAVAHLHGQGLDPWVIDFGDPSKEPGGLNRNVTDHVMAVSRAIDQIHGLTRRDLHIGGYSQGGLFCYQAAALRQCHSIASIFALGSPMKPMELPHFGLPDDIFAVLNETSTRILGHTGLPGWALSRLFRWIDPVHTVRREIDYLKALSNRDAVLPRERQRKYLSGDGWIAYSGPALAEVMDAMNNDRFIRGGLVFGDRAVSLAEITCPILIFTGELDEFVPPPAVRDVAKAAPKAEVWECSLPTGHFGLGVGSRANRSTWPTVGAWIGSISGTGDHPAVLTRVTSEDLTNDAPGSPSEQSSPGLAHTALRVATATARTVPGLFGDAATHAAASLNGLAREAIEQVPRIVQLERIGPATQVSYGRLLDDTFGRDPEGIALLFGERAHTHADVKRRVDDIVARLLTVGVRRGEHIGVLMDTSVTVLTAVAALSRIGAVAVLIRPGGDVAAEAQMGRISRLLVDSEHAGVHREVEFPVHVLDSRTAEIPPGVTDLATVVTTGRLPAWFRPNPGRGRDTAFVLFSDVGEQLRATPISNRRWALSAHGAASAASLTSADTVYSASPLHHASGLLLATAAPAAVGARLALATRFDPQTFWSDVRRYGATVVPYTWGMLRSLLDAPAQPEEKHHPIRLFIGSGMPRSVWHRVLTRFEPASIVETFAPARTNAILANVSGRKIGAAGKPLPGTAEVRIAALDPETGQLLLDADGYVTLAARGEPGHLLVEADRDLPLWEDVPLRGVFGPRDAWIATGELFSRDGEGDFWHLGRIADDIVTDEGTVRPRAVEDVLGDLDAVDLCACVPTVDGDESVRATAVLSLRPRTDITAEELNRALDHLLVTSRPHEVRLLSHIPVNEWFRPVRNRIAQALEEVVRDHSAVWHRDTDGIFRSTPHAGEAVKAPDHDSA